jgi:hypothetical protein
LASLRSETSGGVVENLAQNVARRIIAARFYVRFARFPASGTPNFWTATNANGDVALRVDSGGVVTVECTAGSAPPLFTASLDTWYRIDVLANSTNNPISLKARVDGGSEVEDTAAQAAADFTSHRYGWRGGSSDGDVFFDDLVAGDATGDYPFGAGTVERMKPDSDGTHSFTAGDFGYNTAGGDVSTSATDVNTFLDDDALTSTADLIRQKVVRTTGYVEVGFAAAPHSWDAQVVNVVSSFHSAGTGANTFGLKMNDNGTIKTLTDEAGDGLTDVSQTSIVFSQKVLLVAPSTSGPWTQTRLDNVRVRGGYSGDVNAIPYWDGVMLEVAYGDNPAGGAQLPFKDLKLPQLLAH